MPAKPTVQIIVSSVREGRLCPIVADWVAGIGREATGLDYAMLDLKDRHLPMDDEPGIPANGDPYVQEHTRAWSRMVEETAAFVIVTPQYNGGLPASLKNAMDHLFKEWEGKPVLIVTYGGQGGTKCAQQLCELTVGLKMRPAVAQPALTLPKETIGGGQPLHPATAFADDVDTVKEGLAELEAMLAVPA